MEVPPNALKAENRVGDGGTCLILTPPLSPLPLPCIQSVRIYIPISGLPPSQPETSSASCTVSSPPPPLLDCHRPGVALLQQKIPQPPPQRPSKGRTTTRLGSSIGENQLRDFQPKHLPWKWQFIIKVLWEWRVTRKAKAGCWTGLWWEEIIIDI